MIYTHSIDHAITSEHTEILAQTGRLETRVPGGASSIPREQHTRLLWQPTSPHIYSGPEGHTDTNNKAGNYIYQGMSQNNLDEKLHITNSLNKFKPQLKSVVGLEKTQKVDIYVIYSPSGTSNTYRSGLHKYHNHGQPLNITLHPH